MEVKINVPDDLYADISDVAEQLKLSPSDCMQLAIQHFLLTDTVDNAIEGIARINSGEALVNFPELKEELGIEIQFHPAAMEELESVEEEDQITILEQIINRITQEEDNEEDTGVDLILSETADTQMVISGFSFGDVVYSQGETIVIYHIALIEEEELEEEEEEDEDEE